MNEIFEIICKLSSIAQFAKDIHYTATGASFYGNHLFADVAGNTDNAPEWVDLLKEVFYLGKGYNVPESKEFETRIADMIPQVADNEESNWSKLKGLVIECLQMIENLSELTRGEENLIGGIAQDLQQMNGLLGLRVDSEYDVNTGVDVQNGGCFKDSETGDSYEYLLDDEEDVADNAKWTGAHWITIKPNGDAQKGRKLRLEVGETPKEAIEKAYHIKLDDEEDDDDKQTTKKKVKKETKGKKDFTITLEIDGREVKEKISLTEEEHNDKNIIKKKLEELKSKHKGSTIKSHPFKDID